MYILVSLFGLEEPLQQHQEEYGRHFKAGGQQHEDAKKDRSSFQIKKEANPEQNLFDQIDVAGNEIRKNRAIKRQQTKEIK